MGLRSRLFSGDTRLEACLINDQAHLTIGTVGPFVRKVQKAVAVITGRSVSREDIEGSRYGQSTADAVLAYKQARNIVNRSYQATADNIVGKMTIKSLDEDMARNESAPAFLQCGDPVMGAAPARRTTTKQTRGTLNFAIGDVPFALPSLLRISWQISTLGVSKNGRRLASQVEACNKILSNDLLITQVGPDLTVVRPFEYNEVVAVVGPDANGLVKAAFKAHQGLPSELRVIVHPLTDPQPTFGVTKYGPYDGEHLGTCVILNADLQRSDNITLLHEMIHAAGFLVHDSEKDTPGSIKDDTSAFSSLDHRDHVRDVHAARLKSMPWCIRFPDQF
jgi:hypothetical protein